MITDLDGEIVQHIEYVPFGEVFIEERNNTWDTPYLFNAKELDEETGLYYYGARYYDPRISLWLSTDPLQEKHPNKTPYHYCSLNPVNRFDPKGLTDYFNLKGDKVKQTNDNPGLKKVVLTQEKKDMDAINRSIDEGNVITPFSNDEMSNIDKIYEFGDSDKKGIEKGFKRSNVGPSVIVEGKDAGKIVGKDWVTATMDLENRGGTAYADGHLHPFGYDDSGNIINIGTPSPSGSDMQSQGSQGYNYPEPSFIMGYVQERDYSNSFGTGSVSSVGGVSVKYKDVKTIGFYNSEGSITTISWGSLKDAMKKINKAK
ncbi:hypothetical protein JCM30204_02040 [Dysgonomonas termitidis]